MARLSAGWKALSHRTADMNSLITLGTFAAFGYSLVVTFLPGLLPDALRHVYYEAVGVIITLILLGRLLETKAKAAADTKAAKPATVKAAAAKTTTSKTATAKTAATKTAAAKTTAAKVPAAEKATVAKSAVAKAPRAPARGRAVESVATVH